MIHPTAIISSEAYIDESVSIGPYSIIEAGVRIGKNTMIDAHTVIKGSTTIGKNNRIASFVSLGEDPQDKKYKGEMTFLEIGDDNLIREFCTINRGTVQDKGVTRIGSNNWIMAYVHIAHDCEVGNHVVFANNTQMAGHVHIGDFVILGGFTAIHQFVHVGAYAFTAVNTILLKDLPPFMLASTKKVHGINYEGLKRHHFSVEKIASIKQAFKLLYHSGLTTQEALKEIEARVEACAELQLIVDFLSHNTRGILR